MPLYEYQCKKCGHRFERIQSFSAPDEKECPVCQGEVERLISTPARPHFKGSGFYSTDYAAKPAGSSAKSGEGSGSSDGGSTSDKGGGDKGSTAKPAAKAESAPAATPSTSSSKSD
jgi:putative FmdB family regulatory protein